MSLHIFCNLSTSSSILSVLILLTTEKIEQIHHSIATINFTTLLSAPTTNLCNVRESNNHYVPKSPSKKQLLPQACGKVLNVASIRFCGPVQNINSISGCTLASLTQSLAICSKQLCPLCITSETTIQVLPHSKLGDEALLEVL